MTTDRNEIPSDLDAEPSPRISDSAHDLRNLLTVIVGNAELVAAEAHSIETQESLEDLLAATDQMRQILDSIDEAGRPAAKRGTADRPDGDLPDVE